MTTEPPFRLTLGDCIAGMAAMADGSVDVVCTDPPYDAKTHEGAVNSKADALGIDFDPIEARTIANEFVRLASRWAVAFCSLEQLGDYKEAVGGARWVRAGVWVRTNGAPQMSGDRPAQAAEGVAIMHRPGKKRWNGGGDRASWTGPRESSSEHPTQKPLWLMEDLIRAFTDPGDLILDPFMGSGTTGAAAIRLGRRFVGFERDPKYYAIAERRISNAREQLRLIPERTSKPKQGSLL